jgi:hypothetical protein
MTQTDTATVRKQVVVDAPLRQTGPKARARHEWSRAQRSRLDYKIGQIRQCKRPLRLRSDGSSGRSGTANAASCMTSNDWQRSGS